MASSYLKTLACVGLETPGAQSGEPQRSQSRLWSACGHRDTIPRKIKTTKRCVCPEPGRPPLWGSQPQGACRRTKPRGQGPRGWTWKQTDPAANVLGVGGGAPVSGASPSLLSAQPALSSGSGSSLSAESDSRKMAVITDGGISQSGRLTTSRDTSMRKPRAPTIRPGRGIRPKPPPPAPPYSSGRGRREESPTPGIPRLLHKAW